MKHKCIYHRQQVDGGFQFDLSWHGINTSVNEAKGFVITQAKLKAATEYQQYEFECRRGKIKTTNTVWLKFQS